MRAAVGGAGRPTLATSHHAGAALPSHLARGGPSQRPAARPPGSRAAARPTCSQPVAGTTPCGTAAPGVAVNAAAAALGLEAPGMHFPDLSRLSRFLMPDSEEYQAATLGSSTMAKRLRAGVAAAAADAMRRPVCVQGEPGLRKHHIAAQIHYSAGEGAEDLPLYKVDLAASANPAALLFGGDASANVPGGSTLGLGWEPQAAPALVLTSDDCKDLELCQEEFWFVVEEKDRFRINLLEVFPLLRSILKSGVYPAGINTHITPYIYPLLLAALFFGPQDRDHSVALNLVWAYWWPGIFILYPLLGRWWCSVCPFMVTGDLVQSWRAKLLPDVQFLKWPKKAAEEQGPWFVLALFAAILVWEDVWHLNSNAALTGWLLSLITAGAVASGLLFPKRFWCRYLRPIGGMNGLFAKLSATELRSQSGVCSSECTTYSCLKGAPEGQQPANVPQGCPYQAHSNSLQDNSICSLCSTCVTVCPHDNVELRLRPPGIDLWALPQTSTAEAALLFLLIGAVFLHREDQVLAMLHLDPSLLDNQLASCGMAAATLVAPGLLLWAAHSAVITGKLSASRLGSFWALLASGPSDASSGSGSGDKRARAAAPFVKIAYSYVPLAWGATLAVYSDLLLREAGTVLQVGAASLGMAPDVAPGFEVHQAVVSFIQASLVLGSLAASLLLLAHYLGAFKRTNRARWHDLHVAEHAAIMTAAAACLWAVVVN